MAAYKTFNCARRSGVDRSTGQRWRWFEQKRLDWVAGYRILLRVEVRFWERREQISGVQRILDACRRLVLAEMGKTVSQ